jgi:CrcB protein
MIEVLFVALGGAIGAILRYLTGLITIQAVGKSQVLTGTVIANSLGCLLAGVLLGWITAVDHPGDGILLFLTVGILGSYTTFSTFSLEISRLLKESWGELSTYLFLQMVVAIGLAALGYMITLWIAGGVHG